MHGLLAHQNIKRIRIKDQLSALAAVDRFPEVEWVLSADNIDVNQAGMMLGTVSDQAAGTIAFKID